MDPEQDIDKANKIIEDLKNSIGLRKSYELEIKQNYGPVCNPDTYWTVLPEKYMPVRRIPIKIDKEYFKQLDEKEFSAVILHEFFHVKRGWIEFAYALLMNILLIIIPWHTVHNHFYITQNTFRLIFLPLVGLWFLLILFLHRFDEYDADAFHLEHDSKLTDSMISALQKIKKDKSWLEEKFYLLHHPTNEKRIRRLKNL